jgi:adenylate cyclase class 2
MKDTEIEIKVSIEKEESLIRFLEQNAKFVSENHQVDEYFSPAHRDFLESRPVKEWLRLRDSDGKYSINYKNWHYDDSGKSHHCDEYESKVEDLGQFKKVLTALNFKLIVKVDKARRAWVYKDYEISMDAVVGLGDFVEIEHKGREENLSPQDITKEMVKFLKDIGCGQIKRNYVGYPFQLLFPDEVEKETELII